MKLIERLKELYDASNKIHVEFNKGPWQTSFRHYGLEPNCRDVKKLIEVTGRDAEMSLGGYVEPVRGWLTAVDVALIAEMRNALPKILAVVEAAQEHMAKDLVVGAKHRLEDALKALESDE